MINATIYPSNIECCFYFVRVNNEVELFMDELSLLGVDTFEIEVTFEILELDMTLTLFNKESLFSELLKVSFVFDEELLNAL